ncbi:MAG: nucleotidyl transferase AbiEii/AbiGii toxin family protein [Bdellovibrionales bacterium]
MKKSPFYAQAALMLKCVPAIAEESCFAMKGGTAINMFIQSMPRLSVDIDLTYVPIEDRDTSLAKLTEALERISKKIEQSIPKSKVNKTKRDGRLIKLVVSTSEAKIKIEPNEVLRGTTAPPIMMDLVKAAEDLFEMSVRMPIVPMADLYGGKICAALDRQHPRDLFDVKMLLDNDGFNDEVRKGFLVFLASHDRPMQELLNPNLKSISEIYNKEFKDMTEEIVSLEELYKARENLIQKIKKSLIDDEKDFLLSLKSTKPKWDLLGLPNIEKLPGIQWKLMNIKKMSTEKRNEQIKKLEKVLNFSSINSDG